jgi:hypothetical protein
MDALDQIIMDNQTPNKEPPIPGCGFIGQHTFFVINLFVLSDYWSEYRIGCHRWNCTRSDIENGSANSFSFERSMNPRSPDLGPRCQRKASVHVQLDCYSLGYFPNNHIYVYVAIGSFWVHGHSNYGIVWTKSSFS